MTEIAKSILQSYNLGFTETHHHSKSIAYAIRTLAQNINPKHEKNPTDEWSKGYLVGITDFKQKLVKIAEDLENF